MLLYIDPTDIYSLQLGIIKEGNLVKHSDHKVGPEDFLNMLIKDLNAWEVGVDNITAVVVVKGPGSATALRAGVSIANSIGFIKAVPVIGITRIDSLEATGLIQKNIDFITQNLNTKFIPLSPVYEREAV